MTDTIHTMLAELRARVYLHIDTLIAEALDEHDRAIEKANRSLGQRRRWMASK